MFKECLKDLVVERGQLFTNIIILDNLIREIVYEM